MILYSIVKISLALYKVNYSRYTQKIRNKITVSDSVKTRKSASWVVEMLC